MPRNGKVFLAKNAEPLRSKTKKTLDYRDKNEKWIVKKEKNLVERLP